MAISVPISAVKTVVFTLLLSFAASPVAGKTILVLGDSISSAYKMGTQQGWVALLQAKLADMGSDYYVANASISGATSADGLHRIVQELELQRPAIVVVELGANDGLRGLPPQTLRANLAEIIGRAQQSGARVLLLGMRIPPNYGKRYVEAFYGVFADLARQFDIPWVPFFLEAVATEPRYLQADGLHPNALAQPLMLEKVWERLSPMLERQANH